MYDFLMNPTHQRMRSKGNDKRQHYTLSHSDKNKSRSEPGNAPRIGIGLREVVCQK